MTNKFLVLLFISFISINCKHINPEQSITIRSVTIKYIDWNSYTVIPIPCEQLESSKFKQFTVSDSVFINQFKSQLLIEQKSDNKEKIDTRFKLLIESGNMTFDTLCVGNNNKMQFNNDYIYYLKELESWIKEMIKIYDKNATIHSPKL